MLRLPETEDERISKYVSRQLFQLMNEAGMLLHYFPDGYGLDKIEDDWNSLRQLLLSDGMYTPELAMEYALFQLIQEAIDEGKKIPQINEPVRTELLKEMDPEEIEEYEDIENWPEILFWDHDFMFLDQMSETELANHPAADMLGIGKPNEKLVCKCQGLFSLVW